MQIQNQVAFLQNPLFSRLVSMPARRTVKERADEHAEGAFRDSQELLNWCCPFKCSKLLLYQPGLSTLSRSPRAAERCVEVQQHLCLFGDLLLFGDVLRMLAEPRALHSVPCSCGTSCAASCSSTRCSPGGSAVTWDMGWG